jgi:hypothetical protein
MLDLAGLRETDPPCPAGGCGQHPRAHEAVTNRAVARASSMSPGLSAALVNAVWGPGVAAAHSACGAVIRESGRGADWLLACRCSPHPVAVAEHKPTLSPRANDTPCRAADYRTAVSAGFITLAGGTGYPADVHDRPHLERDDCTLCMRRRDGLCRLVLPQVVVYALAHPAVPRVLVTDFPSADVAWMQWHWDEYLRILDKTMPVRAVPAVIGSLASAACGLEMTAPEAEILRVIACRLWWRSPWDSWADVRATGNARDFVRDAERCCLEHALP